MLHRSIEMHQIFIAEKKQEKITCLHGEWKMKTPPLVSVNQPFCVSCNETNTISMFSLLTEVKVLD